MNFFSEYYKMSRILAVCWTMTSIAATSFANTVKNGADLTSQSLYRGLYKVEPVLSELLAHNRGSFYADELTVLEAIKNSMPSELANSRIIELSTNSDDFLIDGKVKLAYTTEHVGDKIFINANLLGNKVDFGSALNYFQTIQLLIHELGHHHNVTDHQWLDNLGAKVASLIENDPKLAKKTFRVRSCESMLNLEFKFRAVETSPEEELSLGIATGRYQRYFLECLPAQSLNPSNFMHCATIVDSYVHLQTISLDVDKPQPNATTTSGVLKFQVEFNGSLRTDTYKMTCEIDI